MIDTIREIETPEGISLRLRAAGALPRAQAWTLDLLLRLLLLFVAAIPLSVFGVAGHGLSLLLVFALMWAYPVVCEVWWYGQTPGKRALGLRVVNADGTPVTWLPSVVRNLMRVVDILPGVYGVGLVSTLIDPHARRLGDIVAGTLVIHAGELPAGQQVPTMEAIPLPVVLVVDEQAALVEFTERAGQLSVPRQEELANLLTPLTGLRDTAAIRRLVAHANWLLGRAAATPGAELESSIRSVAAMHYLAERERVHESLRREGINTLDVSCSELSGALIERYLAIKRGNRL